MNHPVRAHDHRVPTPNNSRIALEFSERADPVRGSIERPDGTRQHFWGWLELIELLQQLSASQGDQTNTPSKEAP